MFSAHSVKQRVCPSNVIRRSLAVFRACSLRDAHLVLPG
jgi:hypothetical protein